MTKQSDLQNIKFVELKGHVEIIYSVAFSPKNNFILTGSADRTAKLWNLRPYLTFEQLSLITQLIHLKNNKIEVTFLFDDKFFSDILNSFDKDQK